MTTHSSATEREQASDVTRTPHVNQTTRTTTQVDDGPRDHQIDALEQKIDARESMDGTLKSKIEALAEIICSAGDEYAGALFVLMGMLEHSAQAEVLAHTAKHLAFTRCGEFNLFGMVDAQIAVVEGELLAHGTTVS